MKGEQAAQQQSQQLAGVSTQLSELGARLGQARQHHTSLLRRSREATKQADRLEREGRGASGLHMSTLNAVWSPEEQSRLLRRADEARNRADAIASQAMEVGAATAGLAAQYEGGQQELKVMQGGAEQFKNSIPVNAQTAVLAERSKQEQLLNRRQAESDISQARQMETAAYRASLKGSDPSDLRSERNTLQQRIDAAYRGMGYPGGELDLDAREDPQLAQDPEIKALRDRRDALDSELQGSMGGAGGARGAGVGARGAVEGNSSSPSASAAPQFVESVEEMAEALGMSVEEAQAFLDANPDLIQ